MNIINNTLYLMNWACSRSSGPDTAQPSALKQNIQIQDADKVAEPKLQTDRQPGQPPLPLCNRKAVPVTLYLNQPNLLQEELTTVKDVSTNHLLAYIEKMLAEEALTEAAEDWADAQKQAFATEQSATVNGQSKDEALKKLNEAWNKVHNAWPGEVQQPLPGQIRQRRQALADNPCFGLFQELNLVYCQTPSLNIRNQLEKLATRAGYPLTGHRPEPPFCPSPAPPAGGHV